ncbi:hypothetical protein PHYSODRAFT_528489, partial [Phytophthora sojae]
GLRSMSCWTGDSRALGVLLGFQREIRAFVSSADQSSLSRASWWLYHSATGAAEDVGSASWPTDEQLSALAQRLHARLARAGGGGGRKKTKLRLAVAQVRVLLRDLLLVASGLRASCLVDCCALTKELAELLLIGLLEEPQCRWTAAQRVRAVLLDGNVFFVNVDAFVSEKMVELATELQQQLYVDVSASLAQPKLINRHSSEAEASRLLAFAEWTATACRELLRSTTGQALVLEWRRPSSLNATALAGILLCYPCVYDVLAGKDSHATDTDDGWGEQENCLALCPLVVLQTAALVCMYVITFSCVFRSISISLFLSLLTIVVVWRRPQQQQQLEIALLDFSVPRHLLDARSRFNERLLDKVDAMNRPPLAKLLLARCSLKLRRAIERSALLSAGVQPQVRGHTRSLPRVAL